MPLARKPIPSAWSRTDFTSNKNQATGNARSRNAAITLVYVSRLNGTTMRGSASTASHFHCANSGSWVAMLMSESCPVNRMAIHFWLNLEVVGEDTVTVPAGRFATWKLQVGKQPGYYAWVSKDRQWLVQLGTANGGGGERQVLLQGRENDR